jgi:predicted outer membrane repeat protein
VVASLLISNTASSGGAIYSEGTLTLLRTGVSMNTAQQGGGLDVEGPASRATLLDSIVYGNRATNGGGLDTNNSTATVIRSTVNGNAATSFGGGVQPNSSGTVVLLNSTITGNAASQGGGGISSWGSTTVRMIDSTVSGNVTSGTGASIHHVVGSSVVLTGTIIATRAGGTNCSGMVTEGQGYNLSSDGSCGLTLPTDLTTTNPLLGPLQNNGGPTPTMALQAGSPAIDHGGTSANGCPATDQRGVSRPQGPACDIGAYELVQ